MNHSLYIYYLFVSYKVSVSMQIKRFCAEKSILNPPPPDINLARSPLRRNSKSFFFFLWLLYIVLQGTS